MRAVDAFIIAAKSSEEKRHAPDRCALYFSPRRIIAAPSMSLRKPIRASRCA
jgi:hypothetical protein